jgi:transcriptional regulator with XRE-family HTH domain
MVGVQSQPDAYIGARLREERERRGLSLRKLAPRLGISPSALSQIETGRSRPSVSTLYAIVNELELSLDELFARDPAPRETHVVQRAGERKAIELESGVRWEQLNPSAEREVEFLEVEYSVGGASSSGESFARHAGREYGVVTSGSLKVTVGDEDFVLGPGDSICFDSMAPHRLETFGDEPARAIWLVIGG